MRFGKNYTINISSAPIAQSIKGTKELVDNLANKDTVYYDKQIEHLNASLIAYSLDPIGYTTELYFRYGLGHRLDMGYRNASGANAFDVMFQFLGSNKNFNESDVGGMYGSIGVQYSWDKFKFTSNCLFNKVDKMFGYELSRKDIIVPIIFSKSFGPEERTGCFSFGVNYSQTFVTYKVTPKNIYSQVDNTNFGSQLLEPINGKVSYSGFGAFINVKVGKRYVFFNFSLSAYYQNYGNYKLIDGSKANFKGISILPSYGMQFNILPKSKKNKLI